MSFLWAGLVVVGFAVAIERLNLPGRATEVGRRASESLQVLRDPSLDDRTKEQRLQRQSLRLFWLLAVLILGSVLALGLPLGGVWLLDQAGLASLSSVLATLQRLDFLAGTTAVGLLAYLLFYRGGGK